MDLKEAQEAADRERVAILGGAPPRCDGRVRGLDKMFRIRCAGEAVRFYAVSVKGRTIALWARCSAHAPGKPAFSNLSRCEVSREEYLRVLAIFHEGGSVLKVDPLPE